MSKLVQETLLKPELIKNIVPSLLNEIKAELIFDAGYAGFYMFF
jgi:hypothetical protein